MKKEVFDIKGKKIEEIELSDDVFGITPNDEALKLYLRVFSSNQRQGTSSTKTRSEVSGSGRKPWAQKGTGRARVGTKRNPIWVKGGVAHGPTPKSWRLDLPKKVKKLAIRSALTYKAVEDGIRVVDEITFEKPKTRSMVEFLNAQKLRGKTLLITDKVDKNVIKSSTNMKNVKTTFIDNINAYEILKNKNLVLTKETVNKLNERFK